MLSTLRGLVGLGLVHRLIVNYSKPSELLSCFNFYNFVSLENAAESNAWLCLPLEMFSACGGFLPYIAGNYLCAEAAPPSSGMIASLNGILFSFHIAGDNFFSNDRKMSDYDA